MVARDHRDADPAGVALRHGLDGLLARGIEEADQAEQDQVPGQVDRAAAQGGPKYEELLRRVPEDANLLLMASPFS